MTRTELAHRHGRPQGPAVRGLRSRARGAAGMIAWTDNSPVPDIGALTDAELLEVWRANRNGLLGVLAAFEVCRRLEEERR